MNATRDDDTFGDTEHLLNWTIENYKSIDVPAEYVALCADEEIACDERGRLFIRKEDISATGTSVLVKNDMDVNSIKADFSAPVLVGDMSTAEMTATLYIDDDGTKTVLGTVPVTATVSERTIVSVLPQVETSLVSDLTMCVLFGLLTFIAVLICDILIGRRI